MTVAMLHDMPCLGYRYPSMIYALLVIVLFVLLWASVRYNDLIKVLPIFALPVLNIIPLIVDGSGFMQIFQYISGLLQTMTYPLAAIYIIESRNYKLGRNLFILYLLMNLITCITTYYGNLKFPEASRALATGMSESQDLMRVYQTANIGGFSFVYSMVMLVPILMYIWKKRQVLSHGVILGILSIGYIVVIFFTLQEAEYTIALLLFILCLSLFFIGNILDLKKLVLLCCVGVSVFWILKNPIADIIYNISENIESYNFSVRLKDLSVSLNDKDISTTNHDSDLVSRHNKYNKSFHSFVSHPLGSWSQKAVGGHSFFLDSLGKYGVMGFLLLLILYIRLYNYYILPTKNYSYHGYFQFIYFIFIITSIVNPVLFYDSIMFVLPLSIIFLKRFHKNIINIRPKLSQKFENNS